MAKAKTKNFETIEQELVPVKLFKDNDKYKDDVFVAVNGVGMIVPRGIEVKIPRKYAVALDNSQIQELNDLNLFDEQVSLLDI